MTRIRARFALALATLSLTAIALTACAGTPVQLEQSAAEQLQAGIAEVTTSAASGDLNSAQTQLDTVQDQLRTLAASGQMTAERASDIQSAISLVSGDLTEAIDAANAAADAAAAADARAAAAAQAKADARAAAEAAAEAAKRDQGKDCKGKDCND
ncbi:hypothetical protein [Cryobacterium sp. MLB-32]|uniref:hypothetical protein n=1 Tax=Cryobacterium sp. MLB-32 TaxID=1529318 RepID=UPI00068C498B|nr:hypothetical protein [Cryobacterium sp. MLB-32]